MDCVNDLPVEALSKIVAYKSDTLNIWKSNIAILRH